MKGHDVQIFHYWKKQWWMIMIDEMTGCDWWALYFCEDFQIYHVLSSLFHRNSLNPKCERKRKRMVKMLCGIFTIIYLNKHFVIHTDLYDGGWYCTLEIIQTYHIWIFQRLYLKFEVWNWSLKLKLEIELWKLVNAESRGDQVRSLLLSCLNSGSWCRRENERDNKEKEDV